MKEQLKKIGQEAESLIASAADLSEIENLRVRFLGKKGELTAILKGMGGLSPEERPIVGELANKVRSAIEEQIAEKTTSLKSAEAETKLKAEKIDVTMPGNIKEKGGKHPLTTVLDELKDIFIGMGSDGRK